MKPRPVDFSVDFSPALDAGNNGQTSPGWLVSPVQPGTRSGETSGYGWSDEAGGLRHDEAYRPAGSGLAGLGPAGLGPAGLGLTGFASAGQPQPAPMVIPCSMIGVWHYQQQTWEADLGVTWFDAMTRTIEIVYRPAGQGGTFQYTGDHFSPRDRWMRCIQEIPYTDLPRDMVGLAEQILPWFSPVEGERSSTRHEIWQQGRILGMHWEIWFIAQGRTFPLGRHGWQLQFVREGLAKLWKNT